MTESTILYSCRLTATTTQEKMVCLTLTDNQNVDEAAGGGDKPVIRLFGVTEEGNSVSAHVHNFTAYFYAQIQCSCPLVTQPTELLKLKETLGNKVKKQNDDLTPIIHIEICEKYSMMNYQD